MPATVLAFVPRDWPALMWHRVREESAATGQPIVCAGCLRPHPNGPPQFGKCPCGNMTFRTRPIVQLPLALDFHAGED